jgi:hypothetical protein
MLEDVSSAPPVLTFGSVSPIYNSNLVSRCAAERRIILPLSHLPHPSLQFLEDVLTAPLVLSFGSVSPVYNSNPVRSMDLTAQYHPHIHSPPYPFPSRLSTMVIRRALLPQLLEFLLSRAHCCRPELPLPPFLLLYSCHTFVVLISPCCPSAIPLPVFYVSTLVPLYSLRSRLVYPSCLMCRSSISSTQQRRAGSPPSPVGGPTSPPTTAETSPSPSLPRRRLLSPP